MGVTRYTELTRDMRQRNEVIGIFIKNSATGMLCKTASNQLNSSNYAKTLSDKLPYTKSIVL